MTGSRAGRAAPPRSAAIAAAVCGTLLAALTDGWDGVFGVAAALAVLLPLFWSLHHPRRSRAARRIRPAGGAPSSGRAPAAG